MPKSDKTKKSGNRAERSAKKAARTSSKKLKKAQTGKVKVKQSSKKQRGAGGDLKRSTSGRSTHRFKAKPFRNEGSETVVSPIGKKEKPQSPLKAKNNVRNRQIEGSVKGPRVEPTFAPKRGRKRKHGAGSEEVPESEIQRRQRQAQLRVGTSAWPSTRRRSSEASHGKPAVRERTELQQVALKQRAEGKEYKRGKWRNDAAPKSAARLKRMYAKGGEPGTRPEGHVEVIVIPIFWDKKKQEKAGVLRLAEAAAALLNSAGIAAGIDSTDDSTPGQKFGFWETKGVKVRLECGPRDVPSNQCILAISQKEGSIAQKKVYKLGMQLLKVLGQTLGKALSIPEGLEAGSEEKTELEIPVQKPKKRPLSSGDDLDGDFSTDFVMEEVQPVKKAKKKRVF